MKTYLEIQNAIDSTDNPVEIRKELYRLYILAKNKCTQFEQNEASLQWAIELKKLKSLKPQSPVYTNLVGPIFGIKLFKIKDGKEYMQVAGPKGTYRIPYSCLRDQPLNETTLTLGKILNK